MSTRTEILADYHQAERMADYMVRQGIERHKVEWFVRVATEWTAKRLEELAHTEVGL